MTYQFLNKIASPDDVKNLTNEQLNILCNEIRHCLIETVSKTGGHLASNLGTVELTVALHRIFSSPEDSIIFDVGHQCYTHKLLTGRFDRFSTLRQEGGLSGFMRPQESEHDPFITGHSSNSISAAYGIYKAKAFNGQNGASIAVIGDGAMTGGMVYEALNNAGSSKGKLIVVLNDNKMSISRNVGAVARYLNLIRSKPKYYHFKQATQKFLLHIPFIGKYIYSGIFRSKRLLKNAIYHSNIFESLGFDYLGPVDGHDIEKLEDIFTIAKEQKKPTLVHVVTKKGKGYGFAENNPKSYHGVSAFDVIEGATPNTKKSYSDVCGAALSNLADFDDKICAITAAMKEGTGLTGFAQAHKSRFFDVGIAEEHAMTFAAGLATGGYKPFFVVYSSFLQRAYDQIIHDAAIAGVPVKICVDRAGIVGADGETHQGLFDVSFLSSIPGMHIYSPCFFNELENTLTKVANNKELCAIRYPRGSEDAQTVIDIPDEEFTFFGEKSDTLLITYGRQFSEVLCASKLIGDVVKNITVLKLNKIFPLSNDLVKKVSEYKNVYFFEESIQSGGIAEHLAAKLLTSGFGGKYGIYAIKDDFVPACELKNALKKYNLDAQSIFNIIMENKSER